MDIVLDNITFSSQNIGGISVVWYELINHLLKKHSGENNYIFYEYPSAKFNMRRQYLPVERYPIIYQSMFWLTRYLPVRVKRNVPFIFHSSYFRVCNNKNAINITTVHDFVYEKNSKVSKWNIRKLVHSLQKKYAIKKSQYIICISENTKKDLLYYYPWVDESRVYVINNGVSSNFKQLCEVNLPSSIPFKEKSYLLFVGGRAKYKNFKLVIDYIKQSDLNLIVIGNAFTEEEKIMIEGVKDKVLNVGRVSDEELNILYNAAFALIYPSSYEGFGIPILEAQRAGCPVIALNTSSIPEVIGDTSLLMQEEHVDAVDDCVKKYKNQEFREKVVREGLENSELFSWEKMAEEVYDLYKTGLK